MGYRVHTTFHNTDSNSQKSEQKHIVFGVGIGIRVDQCTMSIRDAIDDYSSRLTQHNLAEIICLGTWKGGVEGGGRGV